MATNVNENKIHIGEIIRINSILTDSLGVAVLFSDLLTSDALVYDEFHNEISPTVAEGSTTSTLSYEVDTTNFLEGEIKARIDVTFNSAEIGSGIGRDIIVMKLFDLEK